jgi:hypothetical protein
VRIIKYRITPLPWSCFGGTCSTFSDQIQQVSGFLSDVGNPSLCRIFAPEIDRIWLEFE